MSEIFSENLGGSLAANVIIMILVGAGLFIKHRLKKSNCASHTACCDCETELTEQEQRTQRKTDLKELLDEIKLDSNLPLH